MSCINDREWKLRTLNKKFILNLIYVCCVILHLSRCCDTELWHHGRASVPQAEAFPRLCGSVSERSAARLGCLFTYTDLL